MTDTEAINLLRQTLQSMKEQLARMDALIGQVLEQTKFVSQSPRKKRIRFTGIDA